MLANEVSERITLFTGQKSSLPFSILKNSDATKIINFLSRKGKLRKLWGASEYAAPIVTTSGGVLWLELFNYRWMFQHEGNILLEDSEGSGTFSVIGSLTHTSNPSAATLGTTTRTVQPVVKGTNIRNRMFLTNGSDFKVFEVNPAQGNKFLNVGLFPPGLGKSGATDYPDATSPISITQFDNGAPTLTNGATYYYTVTWWDSVREVESLPWGARVQTNGLWGEKSTVSHVMTSGNGGLRFNIADLKAQGYDTERVTHWILYRATQADPTVFKRVTFVGGTSALNDINTVNGGDDTTASDANLGAILNLTQSPPPTGKYYQSTPTSIDTTVRSIGARFIRAHRDQIWAFGVDLPGLNRETYPEDVKGVIYASLVGEFDYWEDTYDVGRYTNQRDTGLAKYRDTLFFFKERSTFYLDGTSPLNYEVKEIDPQRGVIAPGSVQETPIGVIGLSADGFCLFDSASPGTLISEEIFDEVEAISEDYIHLITSAYDPKEGKYECHCPTGVNTKNSKVFVYDINLKCWDIWETRAGSAVAYGVSSNGTKKGILGDKLTARLFDITDTSKPTFNGQTIKARWVSKNFDFGQPDKDKRVQNVIIMARANISTKLSIDIIPDFGQKETITIDNIEPETLSSTWAESQGDSDGLTWDINNWAGDTIPVKFEVLVQCIGKNLQLVIRESQSSEAKAKFEIEEIIVQANLLGNR